MVLCFVFSRVYNQGTEFYCSLIRVPIVWMVQLISAKFQGRNRQSNSNRRKDVAGDSDAYLAPRFLRKIHNYDGGLTSFDSCPDNGTLKEF